MAKPRRIILLALFIFIVAILATSISSSFARFTSQSEVPYSQELELTDVIFTVNGKKLNSVTNTDHGLIGRGDESTLDFQIKVSSRLFFNNDAFYSFNVEVLDGDEYEALYPDAPVLTNKSYYSGALANAIDVYEYINGEYIYISNLTNFTYFDGYVQLTTTGSDREYLVNRSFKLVYSNAAGDFYENTGFILNFSASSDLVEPDITKRTYVNNEYELAELIMGQDSYDLDGVTIVLSSDIHMTSSLGVTEYNLNSKVGIDLNGYQLKIDSDITFTIDWQNGTYDPDLIEIGIFDTAPEALRNANPIDGTITIIPHADDFYLVQDDLYTNAKAKIKINTCNIERFTEYFNKNISSYEKTLLVKGTSSSPKYVRALKNISYYVRDITLTSDAVYPSPETVTINSASGINYAKAYIDITMTSNLDTNVLTIDQNASPKTLIIDPNYSEDLTEVITFSNSFYDRSNPVKHTNSKSTLTVRGDTAYTIALTLLDLIPDSFNSSNPNGLSGETIKSSLFLPVFDESSHATITWETSDHTYLEPNGTFLNNNYDGREVNPIVYDDLDSWGSKIIRIGVIVATPDGEQSYAEKLVVVSVANAKERTEVLYNHQQFELDKVGDHVIIVENFFNEGADSTNPYSEKSNFLGLGIKLAGLENIDEDSINPLTKNFLQLITIKPDSAIDIGYKIHFVSIENDAIVLTDRDDESQTVLTTVKTNIGTGVTEYTATYDGVSYRLIAEDKAHPSVGPYQDLYLEVIPLQDNRKDISADIFYKNQLMRDTFVFVPVEITFIYDDSFTNEFTYGDNTVYGGRIEYTISQTATVIGIYQAQELYDPKPFLQLDFTNNIYTEGDDFIFYARAFTMRGHLVYYSIQSEYSTFVTVENNIWRQLNKDYDGINDYPRHSDGLYFKDSTGYHFINRYEHLNTYDKLYKTDGQFFEVDGVEYDYFEELGKGNIYTHAAKFKVNAEVLPAVKQLLINVEARFYKGTDSSGKPLVDANNNILWLEQENNQGLMEIIKYILTLRLAGIYHNNDEEIKDINLYSILKKHYDLNKNGYIEITEAEVLWSSLDTSLMTYISTAQDIVFNLYYINASNQNIQSIKGLEYFTHLNGINLATNSIRDLTPFSKLFDLKYLNLSENLVTDLDALKFLDDLVYLHLASNLIIDLTPLQYLASVKFLSLYNNPNIVDFLPISEYTQLIYYDARINNNLTMVQSAPQYAIALTQLNNPSMTVYIQYGSSDPVFREAKKLAAADALRNIIPANETQVTLNVPNTYQYLDENGTLKTYTLRWSILSVDDRNYINFVEDSNYNTIGYVIKAPLADRNVTVQVGIVTDGSTEGILYLARQINLLLLTPSDAEELLIQMTPAESSTLLSYYSDILHQTAPTAFNTVTNATGTFVYYRAVDIVKDQILLSYIVNMVNSDSEASLQGGYNDYYTLSIAERTAAGQDSYDFNSLGITSAEGLQFFPVLTKNINFLNNIIVDSSGNPDLRPFSIMTNLVSLRISGQKYDFSQLIDSYTNPTLGSFRSFYVSACYGLDEDEVLTKLYQVYLMFPLLNIYKDSDTIVWNPYEKIALQNQLFPPTVVFTQRGQQYLVFDSVSAIFTPVTLYGVQTVNYYITSISIDYREYNTMVPSSTTEYFSIPTVSGTVPAIPQDLNGTSIQTKTINANSVTAYNRILCNYSPPAIATAIITITFKFYDGRSATSSYTPPNLYIHLKTEPTDNILITDYKPLNSSTAREVPITVVFPGRNLRFAMMRELDKYITANTSSTSKTNIGNKYYYDSQTNKYYITVATLGQVGASTFVEGYTVELDGTDFSEITYNGITYTGLMALTGIRLTRIKRIWFFKDAQLGDGQELVNITHIRITGSVVNLTTLNSAKPLTNLVSLELGVDSYSSLTAVRGITYINSAGFNYLSTTFLPNLATLHILQAGVKDWSILSGFSESTTGNYLSVIKIYSSKTTTLAENNLYFKNYNNNSPITETIIRAIYYKSLASNIKYYIGKYGTTNADGAEDSTTVYDPTNWYPQSAAQITSLDDNDPLGEFNEFAPLIPTLDVRFEDAVSSYSISGLTEGAMESLPDGTIKGTYRDTLGKEMNKNNKSIYLPATTFGSSFGTYYGNLNVNLSQRAFTITWIMHGINAASAQLIFTGSNVTYTEITNEWGGTAVRVNFANANMTTLTLNNNLASDVYILLEGIIGTKSGVTDSSKVGYYEIRSIGSSSNYKPDMSTAVLHMYDYSSASYQSHVFPLFIRNPKIDPASGTVTAPSGYQSYGEFEDIALRTISYLAFIQSNIDGHQSGTINDNGTIYPGGVIKPAGAQKITRLDTSHYATMDSATSTNKGNVVVTVDYFGIYTGTITYSTSYTNIYNTYSNIITVGGASNNIGGSTRLKMYTVNLFSLVGLDKVYTNLADFRANYNNIQSLAGLEGLSQKLVYLYLNGNALTSIQEIASFTNLRYAGFSKNKIDTVINLADTSTNPLSVFDASRTRLASISLAFNTKLDAQDVTAIAQSQYTNNSGNYYYRLTFGTSTGYASPVYVSTQFELNIYGTSDTHSVAFWTAISTLRTGTTATFSNERYHINTFTDLTAPNNHTLNDAFFTPFFDNAVEQGSDVIKNIVEKGVSLNSSDATYYQNRTITIGSYKYYVSYLYFPLNRTESYSTAGYVGNSNYEWIKAQTPTYTDTSFTNYLSYLQYAVTANAKIVVQIEFLASVTSFNTQTQMQVRFTVPLNITSTTIYYARPSSTDTYGSGTVYTADDFDPALWHMITAWATSSGSNITTTGGYSYINIYLLNTLTSLVDMNFTTLKGVQYLTNLAKLNIFAPYLEQLPTSWPPALKSFAITGNCRLRERDYAVFLSKVPINYAKDLTINLATQNLNFNTTFNAVERKAGEGYTKLAPLIAKIANEILDAGYTFSISYDISSNLGGLLPATSTSGVVAKNMVDALTAYYYHVTDSFWGYTINSPVSANKYKVIAHTDQTGYSTTSVNYYLNSSNNFISGSGHVYSLGKNMTDFVPEEIISDIGFFDHYRTKYLYYRGSSAISLLGETFGTSFLTSSSAGTSTAGKYPSTRIATVFNNLEKYMSYLVNFTTNSKTRAAEYLLPSSYTFMDDPNDQDFVIKFYLPTYIFYQNVPIRIQYTITRESGDSSKQLAVIYNSNTLTTVLQIDKATFAGLTTSTKFTVKADFTGSYNLYSTVFASNTAPSYTFTITNNTAINYTYVTSNTIVKTKLYVQPVAHTNNKTYGLIEAEEYFDSPLLIFAILNGCLYSSTISTSSYNSASDNSSYLITPTLISSTYSDFSGDKTAYFISAANLQKVKTLRITSATTIQSTTLNSGINSSITSINGVELFTSLEALYIMHASLSDLSPINNLKLKYFYITTNYNFYSSLSAIQKRPHMPLNLLPLLGSRDTLLHFSIQDVNATNVDYLLDYEDLNILKAFPNLTMIYIGNRYGSESTMQVASFAQLYTLFTWFSIYRKSVAIPTNLTNIRNYITTESVEGVTMFEKITPSMFSGLGVEYLDYFRFKPIRAQTTVTNRIVETKLPAFIESGGAYTILRWESASSVLKNLGYRFTGKSGTSYKFVNNTITLTNNTYVTYSDLQKLVLDTTFQNLLFSNECTVSSIIQIDGNHSLFKYLNITLYCRITVKSTDHVSYYTYDFRDFVF
ncbi:MAG: hypothetical protein LBF68_04185 [Christensenellaceae bacterium]|nr:hypothetical protein [Christensenellaceae bacterium]